MNETNTPKSCTHCGDPCEKDTVWFQEKAFCCVGCKTVYEILSDNDLCDYYEIDQPQLTVKQTHFGEKYAFLDNEEISDQLYKFKEGQQRMLTFFVPNIHCSSCIWLLENLNRLVKGVLSTQVNFIKKEVTIYFNSEVSSLRQVVEMMASVGYPPTINLAGAKTEQKNNAQKKLLIKLGVAGFSFGNIMLMSFPEYFSYRFKDEGLYIELFAWLNLLLSLPVMFYSATDYFTSAWKGLRHRIINIDVPITIGIVVLFVRSTYEIISGTGAGYMDSLSGLVFFLLVGKWFQHKTYSALSFERDYRSYFPLAVTRITDQKEESVLVNQLKKGDQIRVRNQELIPADSVLISESANIDYSFVTGESDPVSKQKGEHIFAGGRFMGHSAEFIIQEKVSQSYLTDLWNQSSFQSKNEPELSTLVDKVSQYFTIIIISIAFTTLFFWLWKDSSIAMACFTAVLIIACPCALALSLPFGLGNSIRVLGKNGFFLKNASTVENLAKVDTVIFDKTGTLTESEGMLVRFYGENALKIEEKQLILQLCKGSTHPLSVALTKHFNQEGIGANGGQLSSYREHLGKGLDGTFDGTTLQVGSAEYIGIKHNTQVPTVHVKITGKYMGYFTIQKRNRTGSKELIQQLTKKGYDVHLISGDQPTELETWKPLFKNENQIRFNQSPKDKLKYIKQLNENGKTTLMVGDGLNDAGALKEAHIGIAISEDVYAFSPACDAILDATQFDKIFQFLRFAQKSIQVVKQSFAVSFLYNLVGLTFAVQGLLTPVVAAVLMPLSSITIVIFVTIGINRIRLAK